jgi:hypothetical protein
MLDFWLILALMIVCLLLLWFRNISTNGFSQPRNPPTTKETVLFVIGALLIVVWLAIQTFDFAN